MLELIKLLDFFFFWGEVARLISNNNNWCFGGKQAYAYAYSVKYMAKKTEKFC